MTGHWWGDLELLLLWGLWWYPFFFRAPRVQKRPSITVARPTRMGLLLEALSYLVAFSVQLPAAKSRGWPWLAAAAFLGIAAILIFWTSIHHLGRQFRINAGLYEDHELVRSGPYSVVRHPIYASMLAMLLSTMLVLTPWVVWPVALALFVAGTEIRVRSEERLLADRFGAAFAEYRRSTSAYIPLLR